MQCRIFWNLEIILIAIDGGYAVMLRPGHPGSYSYPGISALAHFGVQCGKEQVLQDGLVVSALLGIAVY